MVFNLNRMPVKAYYEYAPIGRAESDDPRLNGHTLHYAIPDGCHLLWKPRLLSLILSEKRPETTGRYDKLNLEHNKARSYMAAVVNDYLETLKWEFLLYPLYSPDLAVSDYWLAQRMQNVLWGHRFGSFEVTGEWFNDGTEDRYQ